MKCRRIVTPEARDDIQTQVTYYELQRSGTGERLLIAVMDTQKTLNEFPKAQIRYGNVRCVPIKDFPFMLHFVVDEIAMTVTVHAFVHAARNPDSHWLQGDSFVSEPVYYYGPVAV